MTRKIIVVLVAICLVLMISAAWADVDDEHTVALLHFDSDITDESGKTWTAPSGIITSAQTKFGSGSFFCDGSSDYILGPLDADFDFGSGTWTIDWWEYPLAGTHLYFSRDSGGSSTYTAWGFINANSVYMSSSGSSWAISGLSLGTATGYKWTHYALVRDVEKVYTFRNGTKIAEVALASSVVLLAGINGPRFGIDRTGYSSYNGCFDELRISNVARWTTDFTPPSAPYAPASKIEGFIFCDDGRLNFANSGRLYLR